MGISKYLTFLDDSRISKPSFLSPSWRNWVTIISMASLTLIGALSEHLMRPRQNPRIRLSNVVTVYRILMIGPDHVVMLS
jgi:hypothetical protein